jgi:hypothetical protein
MDWLRSAYSGFARFSQPEIHPSPIRWYPCLPGASTFPTNHTFGSRNFEPAKGMLAGDVGEDRAFGVQWSNGRNVGAPSGTSFTGPVAAFQNGQAPLLTPRPINSEGYWTICYPPTTFLMEIVLGIQPQFFNFM